MDAGRGGARPGADWRFHCTLRAVTRALRISTRPWARQLPSPTAWPGRVISSYTSTLAALARPVPGVHPTVFGSLPSACPTPSPMPPAQARWPQSGPTSRPRRLIPPDAHARNPPGRRCCHRHRRWRPRTAWRVVSLGRRPPTSRLPACAGHLVEHFRRGRPRHSRHHLCPSPASRPRSPRPSRSAGASPAQAPYALHHAITWLRQACPDEPLLWAPYIHFGP